MSWSGVDFEHQAKPLAQALALESNARLRAERRASLLRADLQAVADCTPHVRGCDGDSNTLCAACIAVGGLAADEDEFVS